MKKSPINSLIPGFASALAASGIANNRPKSIQELMMNASSVSAAVKKHEGAMHQDEAPQATGITDIAGLREVQNNLINPPSTEMTGNIQPGVYNQTGFSQGSVGTADQVFNTPEERNKII